MFEMNKSVFYMFFIGTGMMFSCSDDALDIPENGYGEVEEEVTGCKAWVDFVTGSEENVLLDFSFAGYKHGEEEPADVWALGYKKYDVTDYGAVPNDGKSDRQAFLNAVDAALGNKGWKVVGNKYSTQEEGMKANAIIYFPAGEYILFDENTDKIDGDCKMIEIRASNIVIAGAGRDKTVLEMKDPYTPPSGNPNDYATNLLTFNSWIGYNNYPLSDVTGDAKKGDYSVELASTAGITAGMWVCLAVKNNSPEVIAEEMYPYEVEPGMTEMINNGVQVEEIHQVVSVDGNKVQFKDPVMHGVNKDWGWKLYKFNYHENVGVEDLTFRGHAKPGFIHGNWAAGSEFQFLDMGRVVNGWIRRVHFNNVTTGASLTGCANISAYDILIDGNRGHNSLNAKGGTSRSLFANIIDKSEYNGIPDAGQHHGVGVSGRASGNVFWNCVWGNEANFEAHAAQPRATLFDSCKGGFLRDHQGGDVANLPNHMHDLTIWNFEATNAPNMADNFTWWTGNKYWRFMPPTIVGFHGAPVNFNPEEVKLNESPGVAVEPASLYEAQMERRLGYVPAWLTKLKNKK